MLASPQGGRAQGETTQMFCRLSADTVEQLGRQLRSSGEVNVLLERAMRDMAQTFGQSAQSAPRSYPDIPAAVTDRLAEYAQQARSVEQALRFLTQAMANHQVATQRLVQELRACGSAQQTQNFVAARQQAAASIAITLQGLDIDGGRARQWIRMTNVGAAKRASMGAQCTFFDNGRPYGQAEVMEFGDFSPQQGVTVAVRAPSTGPATSVECQPR